MINQLRPLKPRYTFTLQEFKESKYMNAELCKSLKIMNKYWMLSFIGQSRKISPAPYAASMIEEP